MKYFDRAFLHDLGCTLKPNKGLARSKSMSKNECANTREFPRISVVTCNYNTSHRLEATIHSVLDQGYPELQYILIDALSSDGFAKVVQNLNLNQAIDLILSEADSGLYDGLAKGLKIASGKIICYLNAGDILMPGSLHFVAEHFSNNPDSLWITGHPTIVDLNGAKRVHIPPCYNNLLIKLGYYDGLRLPLIQQESTFWSKDLMLQVVNLDSLRNFSLAGDFYLWINFAKKSKLKTVRRSLGAFVKHDNHLSSNRAQYIKEIKLISENCVQKDSFLSNTLYMLIRIHYNLYSLVWRILKHLKFIVKP
jgi:glycosyltransferase involved in cell wall biosynthesis